MSEAQNASNLHHKLIPSRLRSPWNKRGHWLSICYTGSAEKPLCSGKIKSSMVPQQQISSQTALQDCFSFPSAPNSKQRKGARSSHFSKCFNKRLLNKHITHLKIEKKFYSGDESNQICILTVVGERHLAGACGTGVLPASGSFPSPDGFYRTLPKNAARPRGGIFLILILAGGT